MTEKVATIDPDRDLRDAVDAMLELQVGAIVVVDVPSSKLVGIVTYVDVLRAVRDLVWG
jgi:CBS domain-containing protein